MVVEPDSHISPCLTLKSGTACFWVIVFAVNLYMVFPLTSIDYWFIDTGEIVYTSKLIALGRIPYRDIFSHHFFGYLAPFLIIELLFGITPAFVWILAISFNFANSILVFHILRRLCGSRSAYFGALFAVTAGWFPRWQGQVFNLQSLVLPFIYLFILGCLVAHDSRRTRHWFGLGLVFGWLAVSDIRNVVFGLIAAPFLLSNPRLLRKTLIPFAFAAVVVPGTAILYLWAHDALGQFVFQNFIFPLRYRNFGELGERHHYIQFVRSHFHAHLNEFLLACIGMLVLAVRPWPASRKFLFVTLLLCALFASAMGGRGFSNYMLYFSPWVVLSSGVLADSALSIGFFRRFGAGLVALVCFLNVFGGPLSMQFRLGQLRFPFDPHSNAKKAARFIESRTVPESAVFIWGYYPQLYLFSKRFSRWRVLEQLPLTGGNYDSPKFSTQGIVPQIVREFQACLRERPPEYLVHYQKRRRSFPKNCVALGDSQINGEFEKRRHLKYLKNFVQRHYRLVKSFSSPCDRIRVFALSPDSKYRPRRDGLENVCRQERLL